MYGLYHIGILPYTVMPCSCTSALSNIKFRYLYFFYKNLVFNKIYYIYN